MINHNNFVFCYFIKKLLLYYRFGRSKCSENKDKLMKDFQLFDEYFPQLSKGYPHSACKVIIFLF